MPLRPLSLQGRRRTNDADKLPHTYPTSASYLPENPINENSPGDEIIFQNPREYNEYPNNSYVLGFALFPITSNQDPETKKNPEFNGDLKVETTLTMLKIMAI